MPNEKGTLYLLPNLLSNETDIDISFPGYLKEIVVNLDGLIAESAPEGRRFLKKFRTKVPPNQIPIAVFSKKKQEDLSFYFEPIEEGENLGYVVDAGMPCLADPGYQLVAYARKKNINVEAIIGPSSIVLSLMLSGLNSQSFNFHGYLPQNAPRLIERLSELQEESYVRGVTQIFIEAPYRNEALWKVLLENLDPKTQLSVAVDLMMPTQEVYTKTVQNWNETPPINLRKRPAVFLFRSHENNY
jgi:16S rRNA (cytidine1402-2'-O)-methyltransferase